MLFSFDTCHKNDCRDCHRAVMDTDTIGGINKANSTLRGFLYSLCGALLLSTNYVTVKFGLQGFNPETLGFIWTTAGSIYALIITLSISSSRIQIRSTPDLRLMILLGITTALAVVLGWHGLKRLNPGFASFLWRFLPALTIVSGALFLKERLSWSELLALVIMFTGGLWSITGRWEEIGSGVTFTICSVGAMALQLFIAKTRVQRIHPNVMVVYRTVIGSVLIGLWLWISGTSDFAVDLRYWIIVLVGAFLGPCASYLMIFHSYRYWSLSQSSIVLTMQPLLVLPLAYGFLGSLPLMRELIGGIVVLFGAVLLAYFEVVKSKNRSS